MEIAPKRAHIVSKQAGAAYPLVEFSKILTRNGYVVDHFCYEHSVAVFNHEKLSFQKINSFQDYKEKAKDKAQLLFTGTSVEKEDDALYWSHAFNNKIFSIAWVDQPINLEARFLKNPAIHNLPSVVLANNPTSDKLLNQLNLSTKILSLGSPYLDALLKKLNRNSVEKGLIVFATEPFFEEFETKLDREDHKFRKENGFDDIDSLICAMNLITKLQKTFPQTPWHLQIKIHPRDSKERILNALQKAGIQISHLTFTDELKEKIFEKAHLIAGARSMFLYEASSLGIPTLSLQPNRKSPSPLIDATAAIQIIENDSFDTKIIQERILNPTKTVTLPFQETKFLALLRLGILESNKGIT